MSFYQIVSVLILLVFYGSYFAKKLSQKRKGIRTTQIGVGKAGLSRTVEILMGVASVMVPAMEVAGIIRNRTQSPEWLRMTGVLTAVLGDISFLAGMLTMRDSWRAGVSKDKTALVTRGIFRISRNPAFLGFDLVYLGILFQFFGWTLCIVSLFAILMFHLQIVFNEEEAMLRAFGEEYLDYRKRVNRYLGRKRQ